MQLFNLMKRNPLLKIIFKRISITKSLYFNFKYFPFRDAIKFPVFVSRNCFLMETKGKVIIEGKLKPGMILIGFGKVGIFDYKRSRSIWEVSGTVIFKGNADLGHGTKLAVKGVLTLGRNFTITAESAIVCYKNITIGDDCLFAWDILMMDSDLHRIMNSERKQLNNDESIVIGKHVWVGCRTLILKGVKIEDDIVVAASSVLTKSLSGTNQIIGGNPARIIRDGIIWEG